MAFSPGVKASTLPQPDDSGFWWLSDSLVPITGSTTYLPTVTWKDTLNNSAGANSISDQQLTVAAQNEAIPIIYGQARVGPKIAYVQTYNGNLYIMAIWCHGPVKSVVTRWANDDTASSALNMEDHLGDVTQTASALLTGIISGYGATATLAGVTCTSSTGNFNYTSGGSLQVGQTVLISGTSSAGLTLEGYVNTGTTYYVTDTNKVSTFKLSLTFNGAGIKTSGSTSTGLTFVGAKDRLTSPPICYSVFLVAPQTTASNSTISYNFPRYNYLIKGLKVYDPRTGLTDWSDNPALCLADFITNTTYGCGYSIDWNSVITVANLNDTYVYGILGGIVITGISGQFSYTGGITLYVNDIIAVNGTNTGSGSIIGYTAGATPTYYYVVATNGISTFSLSATLGGAVVTTTTGTPATMTVSKAEFSRTLNLALTNTQDSTTWIETLRTYAGCWVAISNGVVKLIPDAAGNPVDTYYHSDGKLLGISNIVKKGILDVPNYLSLEHTDTSVIPYRTRPAIIDNSAGSVLKESTVSMPGINRYSQAYREGVERLNKLTLNDLSFDIDVFDEGIQAELGDIIGVIHPIGIGAIVTNIINSSEGNNWSIGNGTVQINNIDSVRNTRTVSKYLEGASTGLHYVSPATSTIVPGLVYTASVEIKTTGRPFMLLYDIANQNFGASPQYFQVMPITLTGVVCVTAGTTGSSANFTCTSSTIAGSTVASQLLYPGQIVQISGDMSGGVKFSSPYTSGNLYVIQSSNGSSTFQLIDYITRSPMYCNTTGAIGTSTFIAPVQVGDINISGVLPLSIISANITDIGSGFYRLDMTSQIPVSGNTDISIALYSSHSRSFSTEYLGVTTIGFWYTALQVETGYYVNTYTPTISGPVTAKYPKLMRVLGIENSSPGRYKLRCAEYDPAVYSTDIVSTPTYSDVGNIDTTPISFSGSRVVVNNPASTLYLARSGSTL